MHFLEKIERREAVVAVLGLGYVGLPLAVAFAEAGFRVSGIDTDPAKVSAVRRGESYVPGVSAQQLRRCLQAAAPATPVAVPSEQPSTRQGAREAGRGTLDPTSDFDVLGEADAAIICVPTPLGKTRDPDVSFVVAAAEEIARRLHPGMLVVLESTTYPGTTEELLLPRLQRRPAGGPPMTVGQDFFLAFSPERIDPGRTDYTIANTPKVIGGTTPQCLEAAQALYRCAVSQVVPVSSTRTAEMVKLLENTFRATNVALVNEFAIMCDRLGVDVWEVIEAASTKPFGFMPFYPGPGLGGHCLPVDPLYLAWKLKTLNYQARFIELAAAVNFAMPHYVLDKIANALNDAAKPLKGAAVLILGVAYKPDVADTRESPARDLIMLLRSKGAKVAYHDPHVPTLDIEGSSMTAAALTPETLRAADCAVIVTNHKSYDWQFVVNHARLVVDTRNATRGVRAGQTRVVKL